MNADLSGRSENLAPVVTFDFPKQCQVNTSTQLNLHIKNQNNSVIEIEINLQRNYDFMWVGKTKSLCEIMPDVSLFS